MKGIAPWILGFIALGLILTYWKLLVGLALFALIVWGSYVGSIAWWQKRQDRLNGEKAERVHLAARADHQHQQYLAGEDRGLYGEFKPASLD
ncbi:conserved hypothetical protein [Rhodococcus sp. RD6.2]|uniref:hypothetical protein n=1 Tax=Rhodococcus sp. RD6.2 TaxID=260936 RepID=UPI00063BA6C0|nr:hypothetical protein [Rhodococcus sp. RD6.2]CRK49537.1 conserved hypothetical protein [Rhodococcus sp. RD6.2]